MFSKAVGRKLLGAHGSGNVSASGIAFTRCFKPARCFSSTVVRRVDFEHVVSGFLFLFFFYLRLACMGFLILKKRFILYEDYELARCA